jgi:hypothetical protein
LAIIPGSKYSYSYTLQAASENKYSRKPKAEREYKIQLHAELTFWTARAPKPLLHIDCKLIENTNTAENNKLTACRL